jgi:hypothetical protein
LLLAFLLSGIRRILTHRLLLFHIPFSDLTHRISPENLRSRWRTIACFSVKRQVFFYPRLIGFIEDRGLGKMTLALRALGRQQMPTARVATQHFAGCGDLKAFRHRLFGFASRYRFWHREPGTYTVESSSQPETTVSCKLRWREAPSGLGVTRHVRLGRSLALPLPRPTESLSLKDKLAAI